MPTRTKRPELAAEAVRRNLEQLARLGAEIRASRRRRQLTQRRLGERAGLAQGTVSRLERGHGGALSLDTWQRTALALDRPLRIDLARDTLEEPADAGHLAIQELLLRLGRAHGRGRSFELATRPSDPGRSVDVGLRDDRRRILLLLEAWNRIDDIGAAARSTTRKVAEAQGLALLAGAERPIDPRPTDRAQRPTDRAQRPTDGIEDGPPYRVASAWVVRATRRNQALVARYPEVFGARFPGSSARWVRALTEGGEPPREPGLVWCDVGGTRLFGWRRR